MEKLPLSVQEAAELVGVSQTLPWPHGTLTGYTVHACRCEPCTDANREHQRDLVSYLRKIGLPEGDPRHGKASSYRNWGCRCTPCTGAMQESDRARRQRQAKS